MVADSSKKAHLMIGPWSDCVKKEVPWNPSVTISHNQIIISGARKNRLAPTSFVPNASWENASASPTKLHLRVGRINPRARRHSSGFSQNSQTNAQEQLTLGNPVNLLLNR